MRQIAASPVSPVRMRTTMFDAADEDLAGRDLAGAGGLTMASSAVSTMPFRDHQFDLHLGQEIHHVFGAPVQLGVAFLRPNPLTS